MPYCCVPFCKNEKGKAKGISFHEFPVDSDLRQQWLRVISRDNFTPNSNSSSSVVCSEHFTEDDYKTGLKRKILKQDSVPTQFPGYPMHKMPQVITSRRQIIRHSPVTVQSRKRKRNPSPEQSIPQVDQCSEYSTTKLTCSIEVQTDENLLSKLKRMEMEIRSQRTKIWRLKMKLRKCEQTVEAVSHKLELFESNKYHGYVVKKMLPDIPCVNCKEIISTSSCSSTLMDLIYKRDCGGSLNYPSNALVHVLNIILNFVEQSLCYLSRCRVQKQLEQCIKPQLTKAPCLDCSKDPGHKELICNLLIKHFIPIVLKQRASAVTEAYEKPKYLNSKPVCRKVLKL